MVTPNAITQKVLASFFLCLLLGPPALIHAQGGRAGQSPSSLNDISSVNPLQLLRQRLSTAAGGQIALEGALDPNEYIVGPGDAFSLTMGGAVPVQTSATVSADGTLVIPDVGALDVAGKTLQTVATQAREALQGQYRNVPVEVSLAQPRQFYVHISGAVPRPGRYLTAPAARVSDVLEDAYAAKAYELQYLQATANMPANAPRPSASSLVPSATTERPVLNEAYQPSLRHITLTHRDGSQQTLDLFRYFTTGDTGNNPYLLDGDIITVEPYNVEHESITVTGEVAYPGQYAFKHGDSALDLLILATGTPMPQRPGDVRLTRRGPDGKAQSTLLDVQAMLSGQARPAPLQPGDRLDFLEHTNATARIYGLVNYPGTYPIQNGETTLRELVEMAGGLKENANVRAGYMERGQSNYFKGTGDVSDLDFFSRAYLGRELSRNHLVVDVEGALQPGAPDVYIYDEDAVVFPRDEQTVFVTGNVPQPGYVTFVPGQDARYYVEQAGGQGPMTSGIYVLEAGSGVVRRDEQALVRSGDTIFVNREIIPESPEMAQLAITELTSRRQSRILTTQTIIAGISALAGIFTAYAAISAASR